MGKKESKKESKKVVVAAPEPEPTAPDSDADATPWWDAQLRQQPLGADDSTTAVYLVLEADGGDADLLAMLTAAVRAGGRRRFELLEHDDVLGLVPESKRPPADAASKSKNGHKAGGKGDPAGHAPAGVPADQAMLQVAGDQLHDAGCLDVAMTSLVVKVAVTRVVAERAAAVAASAPAALDNTGTAKRNDKKKDAAGKKKKQGKPEKPPDDVKDQKDKERKDRGLEASCEAKQYSLQKRGEPVEPQYKDDEPADGPSLYILLVGFYEPALPRELAACGVPVAAVLRMVGEPCRLSSGAVDCRSAAAATAAADDDGGDRAELFWRQLPGGLAPPPAPPAGLRHTAVADVVVDRCRARFATDTVTAADHVYTATARQIYRHLTLRALFDKYVQAVARVAVPAASEDAPVSHAESAEPDEEPAPEPCSGAGAGRLVPVEYLRRLAALPAEAVSVPLLVDALVEQVCAWTEPDWQPLQHAQCSAGQEPDQAAADAERQATYEPRPECTSARLQTDFAAQEVAADRGQLLVYEGDTVNADFADWRDRDVVLSTEHVLTQGVERQSLLQSAPAPTVCLWRHQAARQLLQSVPGGPGSELAAEHALRLLMFESMYAALATAVDDGPRPYPHPFMPVQSVLADRQWLTAECGDGALDDAAHALSSLDISTDGPAHFADYCACELLDRLTMAQKLCAAREQLQLLAAYHFGGDDGLYLVYGHPRVRRGRLRDEWQRRAHTAVGFRDFLERVRLWPDVREWLRRQHSELAESGAPPEPAASAAAVPGAADSADAADATLPPLAGAGTDAGVQLPDSVFLVPGSLKHEAATAEQKPKDDGENQTRANSHPERKPAADSEKKAKKGAKSRAGSKGGRAGEGSASTPPPVHMSVVQFEIQPQAAEPCRHRQRPPSPVPPEKVFSGYDIELERLLHVTGRRQRQYFDNGSHVTVRDSAYVHGPTTLTVSVCHRETRLSLHPAGGGDGSNDMVALLAGGVVLHPRPETRAEATPPPPPTTTPPPPETLPTTRRSVRRRSPLDKKDDKSDKKDEKPDKKAKKKETKKKDDKAAKVKGKKRGGAVEEEPPPPPSPLPAADAGSPSSVEVPPASRRVQTLRLSCPSGLTVELQPDPFWPGPEPRVRVVQYYVDAACRRCRLRVHLGDGTLLLMNGDDQPANQVLMVTVDGGVATLADTAAGLVVVSEVTPSGRRVSYAADGPAPRRPLLSKLATDPVTSELYVQREDGARAVLRPNGQSVLQLADGTRFTATSAPAARPACRPEGADCRPPGCSDYLVNEAGWIGAPRVAWLLGMRVTIDDDAADELTVLTEHPHFARVLMDQRRRRCEVRLPQGLLLEATSDGVFYLTQPDGSTMQIDDQVVCFSTPAAGESRPVVHTLRLGAAEPPAEPPAGPADGGDPSRTQAVAEPPAGPADGGNPSRTQTVAEQPTGTGADADSSTGDPAVSGPPTGDPFAAGLPVADSSAVATDCLQSTPPLVSLCETVDSAGAVWRVTCDGELVSVDSPEEEQLPDPLSLAVRHQLDLETVMPELPRLFVLYRQGDGVQLLPSAEVDAYLKLVEQTPEAIVIREPHMGDAELTTVTTFRPVTCTLADRWRMPYCEANIVPANLRCRDLRLLCPVDDPPPARSTVWGHGEPAAAAPPRPVHLPAGLVCTRELLIVPALEDARRQVTLQTVHRARLQHRADDDAQLLPADPPVAMRVARVYEPDRLLETLASWQEAELAPPPPPPPRVRLPSRALSVCPPSIREFDKIIIYRDMLRKHRFPSYFLTSAGREFLGTVRQQVGDAPSPCARRLLSDAPVRLTPLGQPAPCQAVTCQPARLDLGLVRRGDTAAARLRLVNASAAELAYHVTPPPPPVGLRVRPDRGVLPPLGDAWLSVEFSATGELHGRSVYALLALVVEEVQRLYVPVAVCVASGGCADVLRGQHDGPPTA